MAPIQPLRGWFLDSIVSIDAVHPGFVGHVLRGSTERRQVIAAYLASRRTSNIDAREAADFLSGSRHEAILAAAYGEVPRGFRRALARCGPQPFRRDFYRYLHSILRAEVRPEMRSLIGSLPSIDPVALKVARILPQQLRTPEIVSSVRKIEHARDLATVYRLFAAHGVPEDAMTQALRRARSWRGLREFARRWSLRVAFPPHPVPAEEGYRPITTGVELKAVGRTFTNCMATYLLEVLDGRSSFALVRKGEAEAVVHLRLRGGGWTLEDIYGPDNDAPDEAVERLAEAHLLQFGIDREVPQFRGRKWSALARLAGQHPPILFE